MFNGIFNQPGGDCHEKREERCCPNNCLWLIIILILLFCFCGCGAGKMRNFCLSVNPCCLLLLLGVLFCCGGAKICDRH